MVTYIPAGQTLTAGTLNASFQVGQLVFRATRDTAQSIATSTVATTANALSWETINYDDLTGWSSGDPTRYTPPVAGWYMCTGAGSFASSTAGVVRGVGWLTNGSLPDASGARPHATTAFASAALTAEARSVPFEFNGTTDYVELAPFQDTGGALNTATGSVRPYIAVYYVAPS
jgi:hypothetical protein